MEEKAKDMQKNETEIPCKKCYICEHGFSDLESHFRLDGIHSNLYESLTCQICEKSFNKSKTLRWNFKRHLINVHSEGKKSKM